MSCQKAIGVAHDMEDRFSGELTVKFYTMDAEEAKGYTFKGSTAVLLDGKTVPIRVAMDKNAMEAFLSEQIHPLTGPETH